MLMTLVLLAFILIDIVGGIRVDSICVDGIAEPGNGVDDICVEGICVGGIRVDSICVDGIAEPGIDDWC